MIRIDMSEYQEKHTVSRLVGAPPGYIGYEEGGQLTEAVRRRPYCVILLDEIEKAHSDVFHVLLQVLDDGRLTDGQGRTVDFKNTIVIMTSNAQREELPRLFRPEFLNRVDEVINFHRLTEAEELKKIVDMTSNWRPCARVWPSVTSVWSCTDAAKEHLVRVGYDPAYGARPLEARHQKEIETPLARMLVGGEIRDGKKVLLDFRKDALVFEVESQKESSPSIIRMKGTNMDEEKIQTLPLLALKNSVLFPRLLMPLGVGRKASVAAVESALATEDKEVIVVAQKDPTVETPGAGDLYTIGTRAVIRKSGRPRPDHIDLFVQGIERVVIVKVEENGFLKAKVRPLPLPDDSSRELEALSLSVVEMASKFINLMQGQPAQEIAQAFAAQNDPLQLAFLVGSVMNLDVEKEQSLLETSSRIEALRMVLGWLSHEVDVAELRAKVTEKAKSEMSKEQRDYVLRQQKKAIEQELGEGKTDEAEVETLREKLAKADIPDDVRKEADRELERLEKINSASPEHNVIRTWLEYVIELPWKKRSDDNLDLKRAREVLDEDHYGIAKVKERIVEQLAVLKLNPEAKAPSPLCFVGAPGVGKTSLGQSIARALGRKFERMSLGGLHDEAELRGHRRTYLSAPFPGRLIPGHAPRRVHESRADAGRSRQTRARFPRRSGGGIVGDSRSGAEQNVPR